MKLSGRMDNVYDALSRIVGRLEDLGVPYAIVGSLALAEHGYERATVDVDLLLTKAGLERLKKNVLGLGYVEKFPGSRSLRDTQRNVGIDILTTGDYPGDGHPKPVAFPDPAIVATQGMLGMVVPLATLIDLKLASGLSAPHRMKDLADILELIRAAGLPLDLADRLDPSVRDKYVELWHAAQAPSDER